MATEAAGYVVQSKGNYFLSRKKRFVRHQNHSFTKGVERAWVHSEEELLKGGDWTANAVQVYPARYDLMLDRTQVTGEVMTYYAFLNTHPDTQEC